MSEVASAEYISKEALNVEDSIEKLINLLQTTEHQVTVKV